MLGPRIAALRKAAGMSQAELAQKLNISTSAVGMYEQGRREPRVDLVTRMAEIFCVSTDFLINGRIRDERDEAAIGQAVTERITTTDRHMNGRSTRPFSRQELAVLFAALLMDP